MIFTEDIFHNTNWGLLPKTKTPDDGLPGI
jgi:hypothetical protein